MGEQLNELLDRHREQVIHALRNMRVRAWEDQDNDAATVMERLCAHQIERWVAIEQRAREVRDAFHGDSLSDLPLMHKLAIEALRQALAGGG